MTACIQNHAVDEAEHPDGSDPKYFDVIDEFFLAGPHALAKVSAAPSRAAVIRSLERDLLDTTRTRVFVAKTTVNIP